MHKLRLTKIATAALVVTTLVTVGTTANAAPKNYKSEQVESVVVATPVVVETQGLKDGVYVGLGVGYDSYQLNQNVSMINENGNTIVANPKLNASGWMGSLLVGYGKYINNLYYLGGELHGDVSGAESSYSIGIPAANYTANVSARGSWGLDFIPGIKLTNATLLYAKVGYIVTKFKTDETQFNAGIPRANFSNTSSQWRNGAKYGVGLETLVSEKVSIRGEYSYTSYNSFSTHPFNSSATTARFNPSNNEFVLSAIYHIA